MWYRCQKCKEVFHTEEEVRLHSNDNEGHDKFDFKTVGVITKIN